MALAPWKIVAMGLIPVVGIGVAYPLVSNYKNKSKIELKSLDDFKKHCSVLAEEGENKKLLVCPVTTNSSDTDFYFYGKGDNGALPKKIKEVKVDKNEGEWTLTIEGEKRNQVINNVTGNEWNSLNSKDLIKECKVNWKDSKKQRSLSCSNKQILKKLEKFTVP